ncbi:protein SAAL1-like [Oppia nitens]|uniref:protein SAAL1-like n=1 Tax=Oppia nitens TaxID=1686743 RepID=UPI0023DBCDA4|nr:protein SAAL1-like [Oppia nitens]
MNDLSEDNTNGTDNVQSDHELSNGVTIGNDYSLLDVLNEDSTDSQLSDTIGDTVFSRHWLFKCLVNTVKLINKEGNNQTNDDENISQEPIELDDKSEEELSILWDMSANEDVMSFLNDIKAIDLFETIIVRTNSPRFAEITAGILANIAINRDICLNLANRPNFRQLIIDTISSSDIPFVIQIVRIISTCLSNEEVKSLWLQTIKDNSHQFLHNIQYTFENCLNCDLLKSIVLLINKIVYLDDQFVNIWITYDTRYETVKCLLNAGQQLVDEDSENIEFIDYIWLIIHSLSLLRDDFTECHLICNRNELLSLFCQYIIDSFGDSVDYVIASAHRAGSLSAAISLINQMLCLSTYSSVEQLFDPQMLDCLRQIHLNCDEYIKQLATEASHDVNYQLALDALKAIQKSVQNLAQKRRNSCLEKSI